MDSKILALIATIALISGSYMNVNNNGLSSDFEAFKDFHGKVYQTAEEESYRFAVFLVNAQYILEHNTKDGSTLGYTEFADMTNEEFKGKYLGLQSQNKVVSSEVFTASSSVGDVNWVTEGKVQAVKNQGSCGSCWAFSTVASSESLKAISKGTLGDFSEQQLVDCSTSYGNQGCNGGLMDDGFKYFKDHGICTESSYSYKGKDGTCQDSSCTKDSFTISGYTDVAAKSTTALQAACDKQPVSIAVAAGGIAWQLYSKGIMKSWECGKSLDHGVLLAGYTSTYWLVKNSWGATWGEKGYIRLQAPADTCGLADQASFPTA